MWKEETIMKVCFIKVIHVLSLKSNYSKLEIQYIYEDCRSKHDSACDV